MNASASTAVAVTGTAVPALVDGLVDPLALPPPLGSPAEHDAGVPFRHGAHGDRLYASQRRPQIREKPSSNWVERAYAQLVTPMPGLSEEDRRTWRYVFIYPNTTIDLYPDQVNTWQMTPHGVNLTRDVFGSFRAPGANPRTRVVQWLNQRLNTLVLDEDIDLVGNVQQGLKTRGYACGPLSRREDAVAWFADRIRSDLAPAIGSDE